MIVEMEDGTSHKIDSALIDKYHISERRETPFTKLRILKTMSEVRKEKETEGEDDGWDS